MRFLRLIPLFVLLAAPAVSQAATSGEAMCEYSHPQHPGWDFFKPCTITVEERAGGVFTRAEVANGSSLATERVTLSGGGTRTTVNGRAAQPLAREGAECYRTEAEAETICFHPAGAAAPLAASGAMPGLDGMPRVGGGTDGFCLLKLGTGADLGLIEHGACSRAENCQVDAGTGTTSCLTLFGWDSGRETGLSRADDWLTLDGAPVSQGDDGCFTDAETGLAFCFATSDWAAEAEPALAAPVVAEPETTPSFSLLDTPAATAPDVAGAGTCRFLKSGLTLAERPCTEANTCADDACDYTYRMNGGLQVGLEVVSGEVIGIDGAGTSAVPMPSSGPVCVPYPGSPFLFCYAPAGE